MAANGASLFGGGGGLFGNSAPSGSLFGEASKEDGSNKDGGGLSLFGAKKNEKTTGLEKKPAETTTTVAGKSEGEKTAAACTAQKPEESGGGFSLFGKSGEGKTGELASSSLKTDGSKKNQKIFLPSRPSLSDLLAVAPSWEQDFLRVLQIIEGREAKIQKLSNGCNELRKISAQHKESVIDAVDRLSRVEMELLSIESLALSEYEQPLKKLARQSTTLQQNHRRTIHANQPLVVPQGDYLRCVSSFSRRFQQLAATAADLNAEIEYLEKMVGGSSREKTSTMAIGDFQDMKSVLA